MTEKTRLTIQGKVVLYAPMSAETDRRVEVRPGIFPPVPTTADMQVVKGWFRSTIESQARDLLVSSVSGLKTREVDAEALAILYETEGLVAAIRLGAYENPRAQAASLAVLGQYRSTEATVAVFSGDLKLGEAESFMAVAHLVAASQHGIGSSYKATPEGLDHLNTGVIYLARAISARVAAQKLSEAAGVVSSEPQETFGTNA